ncbi:MAG: 3-isopropylmalate dehydrogenase [Actinobacteria bacterium ATB1]|nr:3-isopropylmalate dehydrogenase [Actinobacteria bacterium ATB1]
MKIALIPGDGVGAEVLAQSVKVLDATGVAYESQSYDLGGERYLRTGEVLPDSAYEELRGFDTILLGAVGHPDVKPGILERGILLRLRFGFDLAVNLRLVKLLPGVESALAGKGPTDIDFVVVRENTEGPYVGVGGGLREGTPGEIVTQESVNTRFAAERCIRFAFDLAAQRDRGEVMLCHKTNVLTHAGGLWQRTFDDVASGVPGVATSYGHVDAVCLWMVLDPGRFDVIVTDNLFGDIVTDLGAAISGGLGYAASGNLNLDGTAPSMFEPVHGSAPDIAGQGRANPVAAIMSLWMALNQAGERDAAARVLAAIEKTVADVAPRIGLGLSTEQVGDLVAKAV